MAFTDRFLENKYVFDNDYIKRILDAIVKSKELDSSSLENVISCKRRKERATEKELKEFKYKIENIVSKAIINNDKEQAAKLAGVKDPELLPNLLKKGKIERDSEEFNALIELKKKSYDLVKYKENDNRKYITFNSYSLFPNNKDLNQTQVPEHMLTINAEPYEYLKIFNEVFNKMIENKIPIDISVRDLSDMVYGFANPISIYTSTEYLDDVCILLSNILQKYDVIKPNDLLYLPVLKLFGYTTIKDGKIPINQILDGIEDVINTHLNPSNISDWHERAEIIKNANNEVYTKLVNDINRSVFYSDKNGYQLDFDRIYVYPDVFEDKTKTVEENKEDQTDKTSINMTPIETTVEEKEPVTDQTLIFDKVVNEPINETTVESTEEEPILENTGIYSKGSIKLVSLSNEEAHSVVANNMQRKSEYAEEYEKYTDNLDEYSVLFDDQWYVKDPVIVDKDGRYTTLIRYLKDQNVKSLFNKQVTLKDGRIMSGREYAKYEVLKQFMNNSADNIHTLESVNNDLIAEMKDLPKENILTRIFKKQK